MVRTWWAAIALLAIFAMHGLASHADAAEPIPGAAPSSAAASDARPAAHHPPPDAVPVAYLAALDGEGHDGGPHAMQVLGLCVAVLATAAIALLHLVRPARGVIAVRPRALRAATTPVAASHAHAPPDLHALSVLRC